MCSAECGYEWLCDLEELKREVDQRTAVFMITNPNTLGLFEKTFVESPITCTMLAELVYIDGANMNAILEKPDRVISAVT